MNDRSTFLSCDWGSSAFRLRLARRDDATVLAEVRGAGGASAVGSEPDRTRRAAAFAGTLSAALEQLGATAPLAAQPQPIVLSGMVTSAHGWRELPYARLPCALDGTGFVTASETLRHAGGDYPLRFVSGVRADVDVMRGEECELAGLLRHPLWPTLAPDGEAVVILPGTHSKHARVAGGRLVGFRTFMTGELFDVLGRHTVLRHSLAGGDDATDPAGVAAGAGAARDDGLTAALFRTRTARLLADASPAWCRGFLSGVLIGAELAALRASPTPGRIVLAAAAALSPSYGTALAALGLEGRTASLPPTEAATLSLRGHAAVLAAKTAAT